MEITDFYCDILLEESAYFRVTIQKFKEALTAIRKAYSPKALKKGDTYLDYNVPAHRCAYLYKFGLLHSKLLSNYFHEFMKHAPQVKSVLKQKSELKICCLGGGAGTDVVGVLEALVHYKCLQNKVSAINVLDICGGWRNSFKRIMQKLKGSLKYMSKAFLNSENLCARLLTVDLMQIPIHAAAAQAIEEADIICLMKFVSAVISKPSAELAFKNLASHMKPGAVVIFIDNVSQKVSMPIYNFFGQSGLFCVFELIQSYFELKDSCPSKSKLVQYGTPPKSSNVSVFGWIKCPADGMTISSDHMSILPTDHVTHEQKYQEMNSAVNDYEYKHCHSLKRSNSVEDLFGGGLISHLDQADFCSGKLAETMGYPHKSTLEENNNKTGFSKENSLCNLSKANSFSDKCTQTEEFLPTPSCEKQNSHFQHLKTFAAVFLGVCSVFYLKTKVKRR